VAGSHTWRAYRKEAERFLLWAVMARRKPLSSLDGDDCVAYREFLAAPGPEWTGPRNAQRWSEAWRPFEGALSARSAATAMTVARTLCEWLVRRHYLDSNPWDDVPQRPDAPTMPQLRALSQRQWAGVQAWAGDPLALPPGRAAQRLQFLLTLAYTTGMRLSELANARVAWLRHEPLDDGEPVWSLMVLGKRAKWREVPLPESTVEAFRDYLRGRGLRDDVLCNAPDTPLIAQLRREAPLSAARLYEVLVQAFGRCADDLASRDRRAAERIRQASTHWLRHTHGSHAAARGVPQDVLQANLGHQSLATTSIYVTAEKGRRHRAIEQAFGQPRQGD
jgi:site-specific recombinase XerD